MNSLPRYSNWQSPRLFSKTLLLPGRLLSWFFTSYSVRFFCLRPRTPPASRFIRIQKSYIVRLDAIKAISGNEVELYDSSDRLPIGKQYKELLLAQFGLG